MSLPFTGKHTLMSLPVTGKCMLMRKVVIKRRLVRLVNESTFLPLRRGAGDGLCDKNDDASSMPKVSAFLPFWRGVICR